METEMSNLVKTTQVLVKLWDTKTIRKAVAERKQMIADRKRDGESYSRWEKELEVFQAELKTR
jgi:hypothetical protein